MVRVGLRALVLLGAGLAACGASRSASHGGAGGRVGATAGGAPATLGGTGGTAPSGNAGTAVAAEGGMSATGPSGAGSGAGGSADRGGSPGGGAPPSLGGFGASSGSEATAAGAPSDAGAGGEAGSASPPAGECGEYVACGCGCCTTDPPRTTCFYPERGETLATVVADDEAAALSPSCAHECTDGVRRVCCASDAADSSAGTYDWGVYSADFDRIALDFTSPGDRCTHFEIMRGVPGLDGYAYDLPSGWVPALASDVACQDRASQLPGKQRGSVGGIGWVLLSPANGCTVSLDVTVFFPSASGGVDRVRLKADNVPVPEFENAGCD